MKKKILALGILIAGIVAGFSVATLFATTASAAGGKNRYADELIEEGYQLCEQQGVETVTVTVGDTEVIIDCDDAPGPSFPGSDED